MQLEITAPIFKCLADEEAFFLRLSEIDGCHKVVARAAYVSVTVRHAGKETLTAIQNICDIWHVSYKVVSD
ncbi:hypothetical protein Q4508_05705 [Amphritea sp. 2_MG-2023]|uniref:hypothetical protein n=1 Tax=Amphritea TaxID=515417 RepID=UPI001C07977D|nr:MULTISPECIES: hypothetical protein [Amphritea]MDO6418050.1 hypothetical protein [Amphritea sp. 2_MG-2023]MDX2423792.1 hypothetical protein [Amphritea sp.]